MQNNTTNNQIDNPPVLNIPPCTNQEYLMEKAQEEFDSGSIEYIDEYLNKSS